MKEFVVDRLSATNLNAHNSMLGTQSPRPMAPSEMITYHIRFEDSSYEHDVKQVTIGNFLEFGKALQEFYEGNDDILCIDTNNEFTEQVEENYKAATEQYYDPFKEKLEKTLKQYIKAVNDDNFKDEKERNIAKRMIKDINEKIKMIDEAMVMQMHETRTETNLALKLSKTEKEERALMEIFQFYVRLHKSHIKGF